MRKLYIKGRPKAPLHMWKDNIKIYLREIRLESMDLIQQVQNRDQ
jgi:hypothetical protein